MALASRLAAVAAVGAASLLLGACTPTKGPTEIARGSQRDGCASRSVIEMPILVDESRDVAVGFLEDHGLDLVVRGDERGDRVVGQSPEAAAEICPGDTVALELR